MLAVKRRLGVPILFSALSVLTIIILLQQPDLTNHLTKIPILGNGVWRWGSQGQNDFADGLQLVVFGDSWANSKIEKGQEGRGKSWTDTLCAELNCTSNINFARSQAATSNPSNLPTGVVTSNEIHKNATSIPYVLFTEKANLSLADLATQIQTFMSLPPNSNERHEVIFVISIGFWDIYHLADLDLETSYRAISQSIDALFAQLDILYSHFNANLSKPLSTKRWMTRAPPPPFRLIIPKLTDPSLLPGWQTQRPIPRSPSNFAEQQKNAFYLTRRWNALLEGRIYSWAAGDTDANEQGEWKQDSTDPAREIFYYDLPSYLLDLIIERSLEIDGLTDADGLGTNQSPLVDVYLPCVSEDEASKLTTDYVELDGKMVCKSPRSYLWWDGWSLGCLASEEVGKRVSTMVQEDDYMGKVVEAEEEGFQSG